MIGIGIANSIGLNSAAAAPDPAASAYFTATGITGATQQTAIDNLVKGLKQDGLWSKMKAVYPFVTDNRNLLSYTEDFSNAVWVTSDGCSVATNSAISPIGTLTADTVSFGTNTLSRIQQYPFALATYTYSVWLKTVSGTTTISFGNWDDFNTITVTSDWQRFTVTKTPTTNGVFTIRNNGAGNSSNIYVWGAQLELGSTATTYQPIATTQQAFISNQFKYNLKDPRDLDAAFRLVFNGGWTHSANGATPNGTNGYADTKFSANANQTVNNCSVSAYVRTSTNASTSVGEFGAAGAVAFLPLIALQSTTLTTRNQYCWDYNAGSGAADINTSDSSGMWGVSRSSASSWQSFERNVAISKTTNTTQSSLPTANIYIGAVNNNGTAINFSFRQIAFAHMGNSLTNSEFNNLYTRVQAFQTALSRQV